MNTHVAELRQICQYTTGAPFLVRTRVERNLFGMLNAVMLETIGVRAISINSPVVESQISSSDMPDTPARGLALDIAHVFEQFTYLCDTSNWSNDGQDVRIQSCRREILELCDRFENQ